jgi:septal ring-binding cell division protein DamX
MGDFNSVAEAKQAITSLPQELQAFEPWPIAITKLQKYIQ